MQTKGFTLVELLVAIAVASIFTTALYMTFNAQQKTYIKNTSVSSIQNTAESLLALLKKDLTMAGYGVDKKLAFYIEDGGPNGPDKIFINDRSFIDDKELFSGYYGETKITGGSSSSSISVKYLDIDNYISSLNKCYGNGTNCDEFLGGISQYIITDTTSNNKIAKINSINSNTLSLDRPVNGNYVAPAIFYCVYDEESQDQECNTINNSSLNVLRRSDRSSGGKVILADQIVDLQVAYQDNNGNWHCDGHTGDICPMTPFDPTKIIQIRLTIVVKTKTRYQSSQLKFRPAVENRQAGTIGDKYTYRKYMAMIIPQNLILER